MTTRQMQWILPLSNKPCWIMTQSCPLCHPVVYWVWKWCPLKWPMDEPRAFSVWVTTQNNKDIVGGGGSKMSVTGMILTLSCQGHDVHPASSSAVLSWQAQTRCNLVAPRHHQASHYLTKPILSDLYAWWALFTRARPPTSPLAPMKETQLKMAEVSKCRMKVGDKNQGDWKANEQQKNDRFRCCP